MWAPSMGPSGSSAVGAAAAASHSSMKVEQQDLPADGPGPVNDSNHHLVDPSSDPLLLHDIAFAYCGAEEELPDALPGMLSENGMQPSPPDTPPDDPYDPFNSELLPNHNERGNQGGYVGESSLDYQQQQQPQQPQPANIAPPYMSDRYQQQDGPGGGGGGSSSEAPPSTSGRNHGHHPSPPPEPAVGSIVTGMPLADFAQQWHMQQQQQQHAMSCWWQMWMGSMYGSGGATPMAAAQGMPPGSMMEMQQQQQHYAVAMSGAAPPMPPHQLPPGAMHHGGLVTPGMPVMGIPPAAPQQWMQQYQASMMGMPGGMMMPPYGMPPPPMPVDPAAAAAIMQGRHSRPGGAVAAAAASAAAAAAAASDDDSGSLSEGGGDEAGGSVRHSSGGGTAGGVPKRPRDGEAGRSFSSAAMGHPVLPKRGRRATKETKVCKNCGTKNTPFWRKDKVDGRPLCNACGLYYSKNEAQRPKLLWKGDEAGGVAGSGAACGSGQPGAPGMDPRSGGTSVLAGVAAAAPRPGGPMPPRPLVGAMNMNMMHMKGPGMPLGLLPPGMRPPMPMPTPAAYAAAMANLARNGLPGIPPGMLGALPPGAAAGMRPPLMGNGFVPGGPRGPMPPGMPVAPPAPVAPGPVPPIPAVPPRGFPSMITPPGGSSVPPAP